MAISSLRSALVSVGIALLDIKIAHPIAGRYEIDPDDPADLEALAELAAVCARAIDPLFAAIARHGGVICDGMEFDDDIAAAVDAALYPHLIDAANARRVELGRKSKASSNG